MRQEDAFRYDPDRHKISFAAGVGMLPIIIAARRSTGKTVRTSIAGVRELQQYRLTTHMTWEQLAAFIGVSRPALWSWCRPIDPRRDVSATSVTKVFKKTGIDIGPRSRRR